MDRNFIPVIPPFQSFCVSPLGLIPKKIPGDFRLIHHLSFPKGMSINDGIASENTHVQYARVSDAIKLIKRAGPGCYLAKTDIKSAFRIIPIHPNDYPLLGMHGADYTITTAVCQWDVQVLVRHLRFLVLLSSGLLDIGSELMTSFIY